MTDVKDIDPTVIDADGWVEALSSVLDISDKGVLRDYCVGMIMAGYMRGYKTGQLSSLNKETAG